tara:strand:- start:744 stop:1967 length:1224 start_codon:yes stop_codon:yes gene_type:complete
MDLEDVRREFPVTEVSAYLESAYHGPFPTSGACAISNYVDRWSRYPYPDGRVDEWLQWVEQVRKKVADLMQVTPQEIVFTRSTTDGLHLIANSLLKPGDGILVGGLDHPANYITWGYLADRGIDVTIVPHRDGGMAIEDLAAAIGPKTRAIGLCLVNTYNGYRENLSDLSHLCAEHGLHLLLDGIKALGHLHVDLVSNHVAALSAGVYKFLCSPEGLGITYVNRAILQDVTPRTPHLYRVEPREDPNWGHFTSRIHCWGNEGVGPQALKPGSLRYPLEAKGLETSTNFLALAGLEAMVDLLIAFGGMVSVENRVLDLSTYLCATVQDRGHRVLSSRDPQHVSGTTLVAVPHAEKFVSYCEERGVFVRPGKSLIGNEDAVRVSPHIFNNVEDINRFAEAMDKFQLSNA